MAQKILSKLLKIVLGLVIIVLLVVIGGIGYLALTEFSPDPVEQARIIQTPNPRQIKADSELNFLSYNIGYAGLGEEQDFFMDGGKMVRPDSINDVHKNLHGISKQLQLLPADFYFLQEVDEDAHRSYNVEQTAYLSKALDLGYSFAYNFKCNYIPYPWPPIGQVASGLQTLSTYEISGAERIALPVPFKWPVRLVNLKRCLLVNRYPIEKSDHQLVAVNLHLEAYDNGEGKTAQSKMLQEFLQKEYEKGNYVVAGGDWNQVLPGAPNIPVKNTNFWHPPKLVADDFAPDWKFAVDTKKYTNRLNDQPIKGRENDAQYFSLDGFLVSPNVEIVDVAVADVGFKYADHLPVRLVIKLKNPAVSKQSQTKSGQGQ